MTRDSESSRTDFISEAEEILEEISGALLEIQNAFPTRNIRPELINRMFRHFHSLKGISGMLGFERISGFTHELETMLDHIRHGRIQITRQTIEILDRSLDLLHRMIAEGDSLPADAGPDALIRQIQDLLVRESSDSRPQTFPDLQLDEQTLQSLTEYEEHRLSENLKEDKNLYSIQLALHGTTFDSELREIMDTLSLNGEIVSTLPWFDPNAGHDKMLFRLIYGTFESIAAIPELLERTDLQIINLKRRAIDLQPEEDEVSSTSVGTLRAASNTVRVNIGKLDEVIHIIGELVILKNQVLQQSRDLMKVSEPSALNLSRAGIQLEKKLIELQRGVIETRLVPIGQIYNRLARVVRKLSRETGKTVDFQLHGSETELDKVMIEMVSDPLLHIIRNAMDHGIESESERKKLGKPPRGLIKLSAFQRGNSVVLQVQDDGRGIQSKKIEAQARRKGFISQDTTLDRKECIDLIFHPGFSSTDSVTAISGRGVGLDVVKKNITDLKGSIALYTEEGEGTIFEITLPITLAILQALLVRVAGRSLAIPLTSVTEIVRVLRQEIQTVDRKEVVYIREQIVPLIRVGEVLGWQDPKERKEFFAVLIPVADQTFGLLVDELAGQQEIVIKSLGEKLKNIPGIAGAAEIGEKKPVLVIDAESMIAEMTQGRVRTL